MDQQLLCSFCHQQYKQGNPPRLLTMCGHTYCQKCIKSLIKKKQNTNKFKITCPQDAHTLDLTTNKPTFFPKNVALMNVIQSKKSIITPVMNSPFNKKTQNFLDQFDQTANQFLKQLAFQTTTHSPNTSLQNRKDSLHDQSNLCLLHQKNLDIACIDDNTKICASCAIFGQHKGHMFKQIDQVQKTAKLKYQQILMIMDLKNKQQKKIQDEQIKKEALNIIKHKHSKLKKEISSSCQKIIQKITEIEKQSYKKLDDVIRDAQMSITNVLKVDEKLMQQYNQWEMKALKQLNVLQDKSLQQKIAIIYGTQDQIEKTLKIGKQFYKSFKLKQTQIIKNIEQAVQNIKVEFVQKKLYSLQGIIKVQNLKNQSEKIQNYDEIDQLQIRNSFNILLDNQQEQTKWNTWKMKKKVFQVSHQNQQLEESLLDIDQSDYKAEPMRMTVGCDQPLIKSELKHVKSSKMIPTISQFQMSSRTPKAALNKSIKSNSQKNINPLKAYKKGSYKFKIPQQYDKIYQGLVKNTLETVDLTGGEFGDELMLYFLDSLEKDSKVKILKCIRNKLSDSFMKSIIKKLGNICTLNLAQNQLTDRSLDLLYQSIKLNELPNLKSVVLTQNKIVQRKAKQRVEKIKQLGIVITL